MHVDGARPARVRDPPDEVEQPLAREHDPGVLEEAREQIELLARQLDVLAGDRHLVRVAAQDDLARGEHFVLGDAAPTRRRIALMRAASSRGENGFET